MSTETSVQQSCSLKGEQYNRSNLWSTTYMPVIKREQIVPYTPMQMFHLVNLVEDYPKFVPYCKSATILSKTQEELKVKLAFSKGALHKSFTTHNRLQKDKMIHIVLLDGPFRKLEGFWLFEAVKAGCRVQLDMEFEFSNKWFSMMFGSLFNTITVKLVEVFCQRADQVYGHQDT